MKLVNNVTFVLLGFVLISCEAVQDSAGKALSSAGTVVKSGSQKLYIKEDREPQGWEKEGEKPKKEIKEENIGGY